MDNLLNEFKRTAKANNVEVKEFTDIESELEGLGYGGEEYFKKGLVGVVKALCANAEEANAIVDVSSPEKLSCIIDVEKLIILIDKDKIFENMHKAYQEAYKSKSSDYMIFVSQESKTADIEKQLVSGVQAAKKLVFSVK